MSAVRPNGYVERLSRRVIQGWAYDAANPSEPVLVELVLDGRVVAQAPAATARADLAALAIGRTDLAFELPVPAGTPVDLSRLCIRIAGATDPLAVAPDGGVYEGVVEQVEDFNVSGWAWRTASAERVELVLRHGTDDVAEFVADSYREDLEQVGFGDGRHGYSFNFRPFSRGHINPRNISVVVKATGERLFDLRSTAANPAPSRDTAPPRSGRPRPVLGAHRRQRMAEAAAARPEAPKMLAEPPREQPAPTMSAETLQAISEALSLGRSR